MNLPGFLLAGVITFAIQYFTGLTEWYHSIWMFATVSVVKDLLITFILDKLS